MNSLYQNFLQIKAARDQLSGKLENAKAQKVSADKEHERLLKSKWVISEVIKTTQKEFRDRVEGLVSLAIKPVFEGREFEFQLKPIVTARAKTEYKPVVMEGEIEWIPQDDLGYSIFDVSGIACRVGFWSLDPSKTRSFFVLDEPMTNVGSGDELITAGRMLTAISKELGIQILIITHEEELSEIADIAYDVVQRGKKSIITQTKGKVLRRFR